MKQNTTSFLNCDSTKIFISGKIIKHATGSRVRSIIFSHQYIVVQETKYKQNKRITKATSRWFYIKIQASITPSINFGPPTLTRRYQCPETSNPHFCLNFILANLKNDQKNICVMVENSENRYKIRRCYWWIFILKYQPNQGIASRGYK